jgi:NTF2 fold immunity protein
MKYVVLCVILSFAQFISGAQTPGGNRSRYVPPNGYVPDEHTAVAIAEAVLVPIYGENLIKAERPFHATIAHGVWTVMGTLPKGYDVGGVAVLKLSKSDARILQVIHSK